MHSSSKVDLALVRALTDPRLNRWWHQRARRGEPKRFVECSIEWTMHRVDLMDALYNGPGFFRRDEAHLDMDPPDDQHSVLSLNLTGNLSRQPPVAGIDLARFQRTSKSAQHSTRGGGDNIIKRRCVGLGQSCRIHFIVPGDGTVHTENHRLRLAGNIGNAKRTFPTFDP